jgi:hypothetical protein
MCYNGTGNGVGVKRSRLRRSHKLLPAQSYILLEGRKSDQTCTITIDEEMIQTKFQCNDYRPPGLFLGVSTADQRRAPAVHFPLLKMPTTLRYLEQEYGVMLPHDSSHGPETRSLDPSNPFPNQSHCPSPDLSNCCASLQRAHVEFFTICI